MTTKPTPFDAWLFACAELERREILLKERRENGGSEYAIEQLEREIKIFKLIVEIVERTKNANPS